jgi:hypothetical protein
MPELDEAVHRLDPETVVVAVERLENRGRAHRGTLAEPAT